MGHLADKIDVFEFLYDDEEMICVRDYNINILDTASKLEKYAKEGEKELTDFALNSEIMKKHQEKTRETLLNFALECNALAQEMSGTVLFIYQKDKERISVYLLCEEMLFREDEIRTLLNIGSMTSRLQFIPTNTPEEGYSTLEIIFDLSQNSFTLTHRMEALKERA